MADGDDIRDYLTETARVHGIDRHIRFNTRVLSADWDSGTDTWTVRTEEAGRPKTYRCRYLFCGTGYYNYDEPYTPEFPGIESFAGERGPPAVLARVAGLLGQARRGDRQRCTRRSAWCPSLAEQAAHVTMLQRSPTYMMSTPRIDPMVQAIRKILPRRASHQAVRFRNAMIHVLMYFVLRKAPHARGGG